MWYNKTMNAIEINRLALWKPTGVTGLTVRIHPSGTKVKEQDAEELTPATAKVYRYAKDYETEAGKFCLFVRTYSDDQNAAETALDAAASGITEEQVLNLMSRIILEPYYFEYLDTFLMEVE